MNNDGGITIQITDYLVITNSRENWSLKVKSMTISGDVINDLTQMPKTRNADILSALALSHFWETWNNSLRKKAHHIQAVYYKTEMVKHEAATNNSEPLHQQSTLTTSGPKDVTNQSWRT